MKALKVLEEKQSTVKATIVEKIQKKFPILEDVTIYGHRNIQLNSEHFSIDMYSEPSNTNPTDLNFTWSYGEGQVRMNCKMQMSEIPTEAQAIASVKAMHQERKAFIKAMEHVRRYQLNDHLDYSNRQEA